MTHVERVEDAFLRAERVVAGTIGVENVIVYGGFVLQCQTREICHLPMLLGLDLCYQVQNNQDNFQQNESIPLLKNYVEKQ